MPSPWGPGGNALAQAQEGEAASRNAEPRILTGGSRCLALGGRPRQQAVRWRVCDTVESLPLPEGQGLAGQLR
jgi:hypothetical protein